MFSLKVASTVLALLLINSNLCHAGPCDDDLQSTIVQVMTQAVEKLQERISKQITTRTDVITSQKAEPDAQSKQDKGDTLQLATALLFKQCPDQAQVLAELSAQGIDTDAIFEQAVQSVTENQSASIRQKRYWQGAMGDAFSCRQDQPCQPNEPLRRITGDCNNLQKPKMGASLFPFAKMLPPAYDDGVGSIRMRAAAGSTLPGARDISNKLFVQTDPYPVDSTHSHFLQQFGQIIAHDYVLTPGSTGANGSSLDCSICDPAKVDPNCAPVPIPTGDTYFTSTCFKFTRGLNGQSSMGPRLQINQNTHWLDLSIIYGSNMCDHNKIRTFARGQMKTQSPQGYTMYPVDPADENCLSSPQFQCTLSGDLRTSLHPGLYPVQFPILLEHNRIAGLITQQRPQWPDERIFQETRRIIIAMYQHYVYKEYLPRIIGQNLMNQFGLTPLTTGFFTGYNPNQDASVMAEFGTNAFRFGHSEARSDFARVNNQNQTMGSPVMVGSNIFYQDPIFNKTAGQWESIGYGLFYTQMMKADNQFAFDMRNKIFENRLKPGSGVDLAATNVQRARDFGVNPYNKYRVQAGLKKAVTFEDFGDSIPADKIAKIKSVYASPDDVDLYVGIVMENPMSGAVVGPTAGFIIAQQFKNTKLGDRFFYESQVPNSRGLTAAELQAIRAFDFRWIVCSGFPSMTQVPKDLFTYNSPQESCSNLKAIDLTPFLSYQ